jgi:hypothetical protein
MSKKENMLSDILAAQKGNSPSKESLEKSLSGINSISAEDFKALLSGNSSNVVDIAEDIKKTTENTHLEKETSAYIAENLEDQEKINTKTLEHIENIEEIQKSLEKTPEEKAEEIKLFREQTDLLESIDRNTSLTGESVRDKKTGAPGAPNSSSLLSGILGFLGGGLATILGGAGVASIQTALTGGITGFIMKTFAGLLKGAFIGMLIGSLISGVMDGIEEYKKTGNIKEALWKGMVGFIDFLTFGLIDENDINAIKESIKEKGTFGTIVDGIISLVKNVFSFITESELFKDLEAQYNEIGLGQMLLNGIKSFVRGVIDLSFGEGALDSATKMVSDKIDEVGEIVSDIIEGVGDFFDKLFINIKESFNNIVETIEQFFDDLFTNVTDIFKSIHIPKMELKTPSWWPFDEKTFTFGPYYPFGEPSQQNPDAGPQSGETRYPVDRSSPYTIEKDGTHYEIDKKDHEKIAGFMVNDNYDGMTSYVEQNKDRLYSKPITDDQIVIIKGNNNSSDMVISKTVENDNLSHKENTPAPTNISSSVTNNVSSQTTVSPNIKARDYDYTHNKYLNAGYY